MARVELQRVHAGHERLLEGLMQLYVYDWSELLDIELGEDGTFVAHPVAPWWQDETRHGYLIRDGGMPAGFALVQRGSRLTGAPDVWDMAEFFVVRRHRKRGVGAEAALRVFAAHRGRWEVRQRRENPAATAFWLRTIARFTHAFTDDELDDAAFRGRVQRFVSGA